MSVAELSAPAKLTVSLRVTGVRADGMHLIDAEMVSLDLADERVAPGDVVLGAVAHVEAEDVGAGEKEAADHLVGVRGGAEGRDDLDVALAAKRGHAEAHPHPV